MNTQCPYCETIFSVEEDLVQALDARARCGMCRSVFNARDQLLNDPPANDELPGISDDTVLDFDEVLGESDVDEMPSPGLTLKTSRISVPAPEFEFELDNTPVEARLAPQPTPEIDEDEDDEVSTFSPSIEFDPEDVEEISLSSDNLQQFEDDQSFEVDEPDDDFSLDASESADFGEEDEEDTQELLVDADDEEGDGDTYKHNEAFELLGASAEPAKTGKRRTGLWLLGSLALVLGVGGQWVYANRDRLVNMPELRPVVDQLCAQIDCQIEPLRDLNKIELLRRSVYSHPNIDEALIISLALVNNADFVQPYPVLRIRMADVRGQIVAQRDFEPGDYLDAAAATANMSPGTPLTVTLEIHDPGNDALTFELEFL